jgi:hypothetical protein
VEIIRCICGATESDSDDEEPWIACDSCQSWQHNVCMGISTFDEDVPDKYFCEECAPEQHKELLESMKRGEEIWVERRRLYEQEKAEEAQGGPKKKGKKKAKRTSDQHSDISHANGKAKSATPVQDTKKSAVGSRAGSTKRKNRDDSQEKDVAKVRCFSRMFRNIANFIQEPQSKVRKVSSAQTTLRQDSPVQNLPIKINDLESSRQGPAKLIQKSLKVAVPIAISNGVYSLSKDDTSEQKAERLAIEIETAILSAHPDKPAYHNQARTISANLKSNQELCNNLLIRKLTPAALAVMDSDDMASNELKKETAEMKARADKQAIMVSDDGPRIRRTHKGEEVVEGDNFAVANESTMSTARRRSMLDPNANMAIRSRENSPGDGVELPADIGDYQSHDDIRGLPASKHPLNVDTKAKPPNRKASGQSDFDINKVFSSVQTPTSASHVRRQSTINNAPPADGPGVDPEIDQMLMDDGNESPPYSPAEYTNDPDVIWRGSVTMDSIAKFPATAKYAAGADLSASLPWTSILQKELKVAGRIDAERANEYLCSLRYSPPTDLVVVNISPVDGASQSFFELYNYFFGKNRYGVLTNKGIGNIRDTYLVPVPPSPEALPDFVTNLDGHKVPQERFKPMILIALVIRNENYQSPSANSPSVMAHHQRQMSLNSNGPAMSPVQPGSSTGQFQRFSPPQQQSYQNQIPYQQQPQHPSHLQISEAERQRLDAERNYAQQQGEAIAYGILGELKTAPTLQFLLPQAYQMRDREWMVIKSILESDEKARYDLNHLSTMIEIRGREREQSNAGAPQAQ